MMHRAREMSDPAERGSLYTQIWDRLLQDSSWVPLYSMPGLVGISDKVTGFKTTPDSDLLLSGVTLAP